MHYYCLLHNTRLRWVPRGELAVRKLCDRPHPYTGILLKTEQHLPLGGGVRTQRSGRSVGGIGNMGEAEVPEDTGAHSTHHAAGV